MSGLSAFLHPVMPEEQEVYISDRFQEDGKPVAFKIRPLTQDENEAITRKATRTVTVKGQQQKTLDSVDYSRRLVVAATVYPDFSNAELCKNYGTLDPLEVPGKMLMPGEYTKLMSAITKLSGFDDDPEEEVKN